MRPWPSALARPTFPSVVPPVGPFAVFGPGPVYRDSPLADLLDFVDYIDPGRACQRSGATDALQAVARLGPRRPRRAYGLRTRLFIEHPEAVEPQVLVDPLDAASDVHDEPGIAARGNHAGRSAHLRPHAIDQTVDETGVAVDRAGLQIRRGVAADCLLGPHQLDPGKPRGAVDEGVDRGSDTGGDGAADELAARAHAVERRGGPEVDDDERRSVLRGCRERVDVAIGADLARSVDQQGHPRVHAGLDEECRPAEVLL